MPQIFYFILKVILCSGILFGYYHLFLRNKVYHAYNRYYLLCAVLLSLTVPLLQFDIYNSNDETQLQPLQMLQVVNNSDAYIEEIITTSHTRNVEVGDLLLTGYLAIALVFFISFVMLLFRVYSLISKSEKNVLNNITLINSTAEGTPFSFFRYLFWNNAIDINTETGRHVFSHELAHISERHSVDKIFLNIVLIICWINPFFWLIRRELNMIHEFIADKKAVGQYDTAVLASMIIQAAYPKHNFLITNHFFYSPIKRRLTMLAKYKSTRTTYFTRIIALPVLFLLVAAFTFKAKNVLQLKMEKDFIVVIDAGHGGQDDGARAIDGTYEKNLNLALAKMVKELNTNEKIKIILTRETDVYQSPKEKAEIANNLKADLLISIHLQSGPPSSYDKTSGMEVYVARDSFPNSSESKNLASAVVGAFNNNYKLKVKPNAMQRKTGIWILQATNCPSILIEAGHISHTGDRNYLKSEEGKETFAQNLLEAINSYLAQPRTIAKPAMSASIANVLGLTIDQVDITTGSVDTTPKSANDVLSFKGEDETIIENANFIFRNKDEVSKNERSIIVIDGQVYEARTFNNKRITAKKARVYGKNNKMIIEKYGKKASDGAIIFEGAVVSDLPAGKYDLILDKVNNSVFIDASQYVDLSQKVNESAVNLNVQKKNMTASSIRLNNLTDSLNQPLYILDGKYISLPLLKALDPNTIESIKVLKGKSAETEYGTKAQHGAIVILSKQLEEIKVKEYKIDKTIRTENTLFIGIQNTVRITSDIHPVEKLSLDVSAGEISGNKGNYQIRISAPGEIKISIKLDGKVLKTYQFKIDKLSLEEVKNFVPRDYILSADKPQP